MALSQEWAKRMWSLTSTFHDAIECNHAIMQSWFMRGFDGFWHLKTRRSEVELLAKGRYTKGRHLGHMKLASRHVGTTRVSAALKHVLNAVKASYSIHVMWIQMRFIKNYILDFVCPLDIGWMISLSTDSSKFWTLSAAQRTFTSLWDLSMSIWSTCRRVVNSFFLRCWFLRFVASKGNFRRSSKA